jgi:hypothetical protein
LFYDFVKPETKGFDMKKLILSFAAIALLAGCSHTHYAKSERYIQDGRDCIVRNSEYGIINHNNIDDDSRTVHPNTACVELMKPAAAPVATSNVYFNEPVKIQTTKRVYLRNNCKASFGTWC